MNNKVKIVLSTSGGILLSVLIGAILVALKPKKEPNKTRLVYEVVLCVESDFQPDDRSASCGDLGLWCSEIKSSAKTPFSCRKTGKRFLKFEDCARAASFNKEALSGVLASCFIREEDI